MLWVVNRLVFRNGWSEADCCWPLFWGKRQGWKSKCASPLLIVRWFAKFRKVSCVGARVTPLQIWSQVLGPSAPRVNVGLLDSHVMTGQSNKSTSHRLSKWNCCQLHLTQKAASLPSRRKWHSAARRSSPREEITEQSWMRLIVFLSPRQRHRYKKILFFFLFLKIRWE